MSAKYGIWLHFHLDVYPSKGDGFMLSKVMVERKPALLQKVLTESKKRAGVAPSYSILDRSKN